jgi:hypothetical protein
MESQTVVFNNAKLRNEIKAMKEELLKVKNLSEYLDKKRNAATDVSGKRKVDSEAYGNAALWLITETTALANHSRDLAAEVIEMKRYIKNLSQKSDKSAESSE